jgi:hypothetical protein
MPFKKEYIGMIEETLQNLGVEGLKRYVKLVL